MWARMWGSQKGAREQKNLGNTALIMSPMVSALFWNFLGMSEENHEKLLWIVYVWPEFATLCSGLKKLGPTCTSISRSPVSAASRTKSVLCGFLTRPNCASSTCCCSALSRTTRISEFFEDSWGVTDFNICETNQKYCISFLKLLTYNFRRIRKMAKRGY